VVMCSTAYGGSSQLTDIVAKSPLLRKHTFHIAGARLYVQAHCRSNP
jgi:hypothetical protein